MADPTIPRYEDYFDAQGRPKVAPQRSLGERVRRGARGLARDIVAPDGLGALPMARPIRAAGASMGLMRSVPGGAQVTAPAANPVLRGAYNVPKPPPMTSRELAWGSAGAAAQIGAQMARPLATLEGRKIKFKKEDDR